LTGPRASYGKLPLGQVAELYFKQKATDHSPIRLLVSAESFVGSRGTSGQTCG
jgi:hypothetical protein